MYLSDVYRFWDVDALVRDLEEIIQQTLSPKEFLCLCGLLCGQNLKWLAAAVAELRTHVNKKKEKEDISTGSLRGFLHHHLYPQVELLNGVQKVLLDPDTGITTVKYNTVAPLLELSLYKFPVFTQVPPDLLEMENIPHNSAALGEQLRASVLLDPLRKVLKKIHKRQYSHQEWPSDYTKLLERGKDFQKSRKYIEAIGCYKEILADTNIFLHPNATATLLLLTRCYDELKLFRYSLVVACAALELSYFIEVPRQEKDNLRAEAFLFIGGGHHLLATEGNEDKNIAPFIGSNIEKACTIYFRASMMMPQSILFRSNIAEIQIKRYKYWSTQGSDSTPSLLRFEKQAKVSLLDLISAVETGESNFQQYHEPVLKDMREAIQGFEENDPFWIEQLNRLESLVQVKP